MNQWILSIAFFMAAFSAQANDLKVVVGPNPATVLPVSLNSCIGESQPADLAAPSFSFSNFSYQWLGSQSLKIAFIHVDLSSDALTGGVYRCSISGEELAAVLSPTNSVAGGDSTIYRSTCGIRCGGLNIKPEVNSAQLQGQVKVFAMTFDGQGNSQKLVTEVPVTLRYSKP